MKQTPGKCPRCGARRVDDQIGLEETPDAYVAKLVEVFREVRRVLRDDGTLWLNLGDSMLPNKCEAMIPHRVAMALMEDAWICRSTIIWHKPNSMPESVRDRPTKAHEYIFLLTKSARYYYDADAIREPLTIGGGWRQSVERGKYSEDWRVRANNGDYSEKPVGRMGDNPLGRNKRSVWTVATKPYSGAHFATYPPDLIEPCILAGTSAKGECSACGAPWVRVVERSKYEPEVVSAGTRAVDDSRGDKTRKLSGSDYNKSVKVLNESWQPSCTCNADIVPQTVLDPFAGSGTTGYVALKLGRRFVGIELNPNYMQLIKQRLSQAQLPLLGVLQ